MALKGWMIAFNNAKTMEANGEEDPELMEEYERMIAKLGEPIVAFLPCYPFINPSFQQECYKIG